MPRNGNKQFLPSTKEDITALGWDRPDIIIITGDTYIDSPLTGAAVIGRVLDDRGFRTAIISQPATDSDIDITRLGEPKLFWGITSGCVDSMVANYTASGKKRRQDDFTPGGINDRRPDRALIVYSNLIRRYFKKTVPIVLGGIEASTRRIAHFDFWSNSIRRSVLFDAKADLLIYGMGEKAVIETAERLSREQGIESIPGTCSISREPPSGYMELPSFDTAKADASAFIRMYRIFTEHGLNENSPGLFQAHGDRYLIHHPPSSRMTPAELDHIHSLGYQLDVHPSEASKGKVRALDTIQFSITTHRGCYGGCSFCAIAVHQGRDIISRSEESILKEASGFTSHPSFRGIISDVGGPTANMYRTGCGRTAVKGTCRRLCLFPDVCGNLETGHGPQIRLLEKLRSLPGIRKVFIASGIRYDLLLADPDHMIYIRNLAKYHVSGQLKVAPEHVEKSILKLMQKPASRSLLDFKTKFEQESRAAGKQQYLTYYFIAAHPGCSIKEMDSLSVFVKKHLRLRPEQVQIFTPLPSTWSALMYHTGLNPWTETPIFVEKDQNRRRLQKEILQISGKKTAAP